LTLAGLPPHRPPDGLLRPSPSKRLPAAHSGERERGAGKSLDWHIEAWDVRVPQFPPQQQLNVYKYLKAGVILDGTNADFISFPTSCRKQGGGRQHLVGRMVCPSSLHPFWKSWGLIAYNSWPWANKRLGCLLALPGASSLETSGTPHPPSHGPWSNLSALSLGLSELPFTQKEGRGSNPDYTDCLGENGLIGPSGEGDGRACLC